MGEFAIYTVAAVVVITPVLVAAKVGWAKDVITADIAVPDAAVELLV